MGYSTALFFAVQMVGQTFEQLIDRTGPMPVERAASLATQILDALGHAHRAGIVHRDLKPANLMLTDAGVVKAMDFGIARVSGTERMTSDGLMVGTPASWGPNRCAARTSTAAPISTPSASSSTAC